MSLHDVMLSLADSSRQLWPKRAVLQMVTIRGKGLHNVARALLQVHHAILEWDSMHCPHVKNSALTQPGTFLLTLEMVSVA